MRFWYYRFRQPARVALIDNTNESSGVASLSFRDSCAIERYAACMATRLDEVFVSSSPTFASKTRDA